MYILGYAAGSETVVFVNAFQDYFRRNRQTFKRSEIDSRHSCKVDVIHLCEDENLKGTIPDLSDLILSSPQRIINALGLAVYEVLIIIYWSI